MMIKAEYKIPRQELLEQYGGRPKLKTEVMSSQISPCMRRVRTLVLSVHQNKNSHPRQYECRNEDGSISADVCISQESSEQRSVGQYSHEVVYRGSCCSCFQMESGHQAPQAGEKDLQATRLERL